MIELTRKEFLRVMGADVPDAEIEATLNGLGFAPARSDAARGTAESPSAASPERPFDFLMGVLSTNLNRR